jgi:hypothetical protein
MSILQPSTTNGNRLVLDENGQNGDARETAHVELAMTALALGRAIHAAACYRPLPPCACGNENGGDPNYPGMCAGCAWRTWFASASKED